MVLGMIVLFPLLGYIALRWWKAPLYSHFSRGKHLAEKLGCFTCHGPGGIEGISNPGSEEKTVPSWDGGTLMMYAQTDDEIREWILDGMPQRMRDDPEEMEEHSEMLIQMPAYRDKISDQGLEDLLGFFKTVAGAQKILDPIVRKGRETALAKGCFGCHGPEGKSPMPNPGSLKGYIPPWDSSDFEELVKNDHELEEWILKGITTRYQKNGLAMHFVTGQKIHMPAYEKHLTKDELEALKAYIKWVKNNRRS